MRNLSLIPSIAVLLLAGMAQAAEPAAIVEDVSGSVSGIAVFDYLDAGQSITLPASATLTLGYLKSCSREVIKGGKVSIGTEASTVTGGNVSRETLKCAGNLNLTTAQAGKSGAMVFRGGPGSGKAKAGEPVPSLTINSTMPAFSVHASGMDLVLERLDKPGTTRSFPVKGSMLDLAKEGMSLFQGGLYRAKLGDHSVVFRVAMDASEGAGPLLTRLIRL